MAHIRGAQAEAGVASSAKSNGEAANSKRESGACSADSSSGRIVSLADSPLAHVTQR